MSGNDPKPEPRIVPTSPIKIASRYTIPAIWRRVAPIARMMPSCLRRWVTLMRNVFVMMNTATNNENGRAIRMPCCVESDVSSASELRAFGRPNRDRPPARCFWISASAASLSAPGLSTICAESISYRRQK